MEVKSVFELGLTEFGPFISTFGPLVRESSLWIPKIPMWLPFMVLTFCGLFWRVALLRLFSPASSPPGLGLRRLWVAFTAAYAVSSAWHIITPRGTFRKIVSTLTGLQFTNCTTEVKTPSAEPTPKKRPSLDCNKRVADFDLKDFQRRVQEKTDNADEWEHICEKETSDIKYVAWRNILPHGGTQYFSSTIVENASPDLMHAFYNHDDCRLRWDNLLAASEVLEADESGAETVYWLRKLPVCGPREYVFGRRNWTVNEGHSCAENSQGPQLYTVTKATLHDAKPPSPTDQPMQVQTYYSSWLIHPVAGRDGKPGTAVETILIHYEEMGIPQSIARFVIRNGMWGVVKNLCRGYRDFEKAVKHDADLIHNPGSVEALKRSRSVTRHTSMGDLSELVALANKNKAPRHSKKPAIWKRIAQVAVGVVAFGLLRKRHLRARKLN